MNAPRDCADFDDIVEIVTQDRYPPGWVMNLGTGVATSFAPKSSR